MAAVQIACFLRVALWQVQTSKVEHLQAVQRIQLLAVLMLRKDLVGLELALCFRKVRLALLHLAVAWRLLESTQKDWASY